MKIRIFLTTALLALLAVSTFARSNEYIQWGEGPVQFLMTKEEAARWKTITTDEESKAFVDLFWARRDPTPETPRNEFKEEFEARVEYADKNLAAAEKTKGSMTDRGKALILYGLPKRIERSANEKTPGIFDTGNLQTDQRATGEWVQWIYEGPEAKALFLVPRASIRFVDRLENNEYKIERGVIDMKAAHERAIQRAVVNPTLTEAPKFAVAASAAVAAAPQAALPVQTELSTESLKTAVSEFKAAAKSPYEKQIYATWGEFVTAAGTYFVPVMLYVPKSTGLTDAQSLTFFGIIEDESGKNVHAFEKHEAKLVASKDDFYIDRTLTGLPAGKYRGIFGLAENGKPVSMVSTEMTLTGTLDKDATAISELMLSNNIYPLPDAQEATDPFAFGGVKVIPKADQAFRTSDELWYFFELRNPGVAEVGPPAENTVEVAPQEPAPKIQVKIDVEGMSKEGKKVKMSAPPSEVAAIPMKGVPGHFGVGSAIPLTTFKPGDYTFTVKVIDTVKKASYTVSEKFKVVE